MERNGGDYPQTGLPSPYPSSYADARTEPTSADSQQPAPSPYAGGQTSEARPSSYSASGTPTSEYGVYPASARSGTFPEHIHRPYHPHPASGSGSGGGMSQANNPSITAPSPTYPYGQAHSPYGPPGDITPNYHHGSGMYAQARPEWAAYGQQHGGPMTPNGPVFPPTPSSAGSQQRANQVYSFVPIPGSQQHKRPRRRYEEIERMYKCGWNGCEKAYGTLNHLNAHVTMQGHGSKRTPDEFKEIRKEWKQRKKEEEAQRKADDERQRAANSAAAAAAAAAIQTGPTDGAAADGSQPPTTYGGSRALQLPPIGYQSSAYPGPPSATVPPQPLQDYPSNQMYSNYPPPHSPYGQAGQHIYSQPNSAQPQSH
ncbi:related to putative transcriptional regulator [Cephalotrichum gorgonifer]|uniref:Related to putative transcriptional regulator n=1 Tax=Cephalotrichum gorgonifer TaxID=2041049 RepID=A0AAE8N166_9PEZI|nr:related to putative transcriptional regulator [Cephalotrichum gorgonifer]